MMFLMWLAGVWTGGASVFLSLEVLSRRQNDVSYPVEYGLLMALTWPAMLVKWLKG